MGMFKTIGMITGGAVLGVAATMVVGGKCSDAIKKEEVIKDKIKEDIIAPASDVSENIVNTFKHKIEKVKDDVSATDKSVEDSDVLDTLDELQDVLYQAEALLRKVKHEVKFTKNEAIVKKENTKEESEENVENNIIR